MASKNRNILGFRVDGSNSEIQKSQQFLVAKNMNKTDQLKITQTQWSVTIGDYMTNKSSIKPPSQIRPLPLTSPPPFKGKKINKSSLSIKSPPPLDILH